MNTPEVMTLSAEQLIAEVPRIIGGGRRYWTDYTLEHIERVLPQYAKAIAERDERVRELEGFKDDAIEFGSVLSRAKELLGEDDNEEFVLKLKTACAALKSRAVSGDDREELVALFMKQVQREPTRIRLNPKPTIAELEANLNSDKPRKLDLNADGNVYEIVPAPKLTVSILIDQILAAGFRRPQESSQEAAKQHLADIAQELDMGYGTSPAEPVMTTDPNKYNPAPLSQTPLPQEPVNVAVDYAAMNGPELLNACGDSGFEWAKAFQQRIVDKGIHIDIDLMLGWFANAIEHSSDVRRWNRERKEKTSGILTGRKLDAGKVFEETLIAISKHEMTHRPELARKITNALCADTADIWTEE